MNPIYHNIWTGLQSRLGRAIYEYMEERGRIVSEEDYQGRRVVKVQNEARTWCLGDIIIANENISEEHLVHESGHSIQSDFLGPFYLLVVGIPSCIWNMIYRKKGEPMPDKYFRGFPEGHATNLGNKFVNKQKI